MGVFDRISGITGDDSEAEPSDDTEVEPSPDADDPATMEPADFRDRAEDLAGRSNVPTLDFTVDSLEKLDGLVAGTSRPVEDPLLFGSYLGEVLVRVFDGAWTRDDGDWVVAVDLGDDETTVAVFGAAQMALERGPVFQDVVAKLESDGATRAEGEPATHREIEGAGATAAPSVDDDTVEVESDDGPDEAAAESADGEVDTGDDAVAETDAEAEPADAVAPEDAEEPDTETDESIDADAEDETDDQAEVVEDDTDDVDAGDETDPADATSADDLEPATADGDDEGTDETDESEADEDEGTDFAAEKPELNVTIDEIDDDYDPTGLVAEEDAAADDTVDAEEEPDLDVTADEVDDYGADADFEADSDETATEAADAVDVDGSGAESTEGADDDAEPAEPTAKAPGDVEEATDEDDEQESSDVAVEPTGGEAAGEDGEAEPSAAPDATASPDDEPTAEALEESAEGAADEEDEGDDESEGLGVASRIADLAASGGDPEVTSSDEETADAVSEGDDTGDDADEEPDVDVTVEEVDDQADAEDADDAGVSPVETVEPSIDEGDATEGTLPADDDAKTVDDPDSDGEPEPTDAGPDAGDEVLEDLAAEVSGPDLPPRPELKRAARDFSERWSDRGFDFTPESLARLDEFVDGQWEGRFRPGSLEDASPHPREGLTPFARVGAYFGQMLVEHLDGDWIPTENGEGAVEVSGRRRSEEIHVFDVARTCMTTESTFSYRFDALANQFDVDAAARDVDDVFDVGSGRADSTDVIPAILDRAEAFTEDWPSADLDYSPASLERLDDLVEREFAVTDLSNARLGETTDADSLWFTERVSAAAAYYAAVLVSHLDANWRLDGDVRLVVEGPEGSRTVAPVTVAVGAIRGDDTFQGHFERLADRVGREVATAE